MDPLENPDNFEPGPDERAECSNCGHRMDEDDADDPICLIGPYLYCEDCYAEITAPDPFDDVDFDGGRE